MGLVLIKRGIALAQKERMDKVTNVLIELYRSGDWTSCWRSIHSKSNRDSPPSSTYTRETRSSQKRVGRPQKVNKRGAGRPRKLPIGKKRGRPRKISVTVLQQQRIERMEFMTPPPFVPKPRGRRRKTEVGDMVMAHGVCHTLTLSSNIKVKNPDGSTTNMWKQESGRCVCCYASPPPLTDAQRAANPKITQKTCRRTRLACDKCRVHLCRDCFHNEWYKHVKGRVKPIGITYE